MLNLDGFRKIGCGWLICILCFAGTAARAQEVQQEHEPLKYDVSVKARIIPVFAVDSAGKPVYDLKKEELQLLVNRQPATFRLLRYRFTGSPTGQPETAKKTDIPYVQADRRVIFVILDSMNNSQQGFNNSKEIIRELVSHSYKGSTFVILENSPQGVLRYVVGPEQDEHTLLSALSRIEWFPEKNRRLLFVRPDSELIPLFVVSPSDVKINLMERDGNAPDESFIQYDRAQRKRQRFEKEIYQKKINQFAHSLSQFKYVLQAIKEPKVVFLISEGLKKRRFYRNYKYKIESMDPQSLYNLFSLYYLDRIIANINAGGALLHTVNPQLSPPSGQKETYSAGGAVSLQYLAEGSGGKIFEGSDVKIIAKEMKNTTSAYYEIAFTPKADMGYRQQIQVECRRPGTRVYAPGFSEKEIPYRQMNPVEKKMFALNVIHGGSWSRLSGTVQSGVYRKITEARQGETTIETIEVSIPESLQRVEADVFILRQNIADNTIDIDLKIRKLERLERLKIPASEGERSYFVIVEPLSVYCIYSHRSLGHTGLSGDTGPAAGRAPLLQGTSRRVMTPAGELKIDGGSVRLNGKTVYQQGDRAGNLQFKKHYLTPAGDAVTLQEDTGFRLFILKPDGTFRISTAFETQPDEITCENGEIRLHHRPIPLTDQGMTEPEHRLFYLFFARFRADKEFQLSRVRFPFAQEWFDPKTGELAGTNHIEESAWEHLSFRSSAEHAWSEPEIQDAEARIYFEGEGLRLALVFEKVEGRWLLSHSQNQI
jgi:VWFA-related protein